MALLTQPLGEVVDCFLFVLGQEKLHVPVFLIADKVAKLQGSLQPKQDANKSRVRRDKAAARYGGSLDSGLTLRGYHASFADIPRD